MKTKGKDGVAKKSGKSKYKKAPDAPKRFKSAFIIFSAEKHKEIKKGLLEEGRTVRTTEIAKMVSEAWKGLEPDERKIWDDKADADKARYEQEKAEYKGPWKVPSNKRKTKDKNAPKRPMSAFLAYSNSRRAALKREFPKSTNADLSRMLSKQWKELDPTERAEYMAEERKLREQYKVDMTEWRKKVAKEKKVERQERELAASKAAQAQEKSEDADADADEHPSTTSSDSKWMSMQQRHQENLQHQQFQQQQQQQLEQQQQHLGEMANTGMGNSGMFSNPYLQAAAFGGAGVGQGMDPRAAALGLNPNAASHPYFANAFAGQGYMQGMPGMQGMPPGANPALSFLGAQSYMQNAAAGMPGQLPAGLYGSNFGGMQGMNDGNGSSGAASYGQMQP